MISAAFTRFSNYTSKKRYIFGFIRFYVHAEGALNMTDIEECYTSIIRSHLPRSRILDQAAWEEMFSPDDVIIIIIIIIK